MDTVQHLPAFASHPFYVNYTQFHIPSSPRSASSPDPHTPSLPIPYDNETSHLRRPLHTPVPSSRDTHIRQRHRTA